MKVAAVVLAAGRGRRMGRPKHLIEIDGVPMIERVAQALLASAADPVVLVLRPGDEAGRAAGGRLGLPVALAEPPEEGRAASVRAGVRATPADRALLFALADQPWLEAADFDRLIARADGAGIVQACYDGVAGSPVLFGPGYRDELLELSGPQGGRVLLARHRSEVATVELASERGRDVDRPGDLR